jgi:Skp family chaperone for outer membrane proteins
VLSVRVSFLSATFVVGSVITLVFGTQASAQQSLGGAPRTATAAAAPSGTNVAVIDVAQIFKKHNRFNAAMQDIKKDIEDFDTFVRGEQTKMKTLAEQLQTFKQGSLEYKQKEEEIARMTSEMHLGPQSHRPRAAVQQRGNEGRRSGLGAARRESGGGVSARH